MENTPAKKDSNNPMVFFRTPEGFELMQRQAKALSGSTMVPAQYQGNIANCMIAVEMAQRFGVTPLVVTQNLDIINGKPGWSSTFVASMLNACGRFDRIRYEEGGSGDAKFCQAYATELETGKIVKGLKVTIAMAKAEGWYHRKGSKWPSMEEQMLMYRAASFFARKHAPELLNGMYDQHEIVDMPITEDIPHQEVTDPNEAIDKKAKDDEDIM